VVYSRLRRFIALFLAVSVGSTGFPLTAQSGMIASDSVLSGGNHAVIASLLDRPEVRAQLQAHGVSAADARARVAALSDEEAAELAARMHTLPAGGDGIIGAIVLVFLVLLVTDILGYTTVFPFTRPAR